MLVGNELVKSLKVPIKLRLLVPLFICMVGTGLGSLSLQLKTILDVPEISLSLSSQVVSFLLGQTFRQRLKY